MEYGLIGEKLGHSASKEIHEQLADYSYELSAYEVIDTELNVCIDSDDCLAENAVEKILHKWKSIKGDSYAGLIGLDLLREPMAS